MVANEVIANPLPLRILSNRLEIHLSISFSGIDQPQGLVVLVRRDFEITVSVANKITTAGRVMWLDLDDILHIPVGPDCLCARR
ncbi:hypothetical protein C5615_38185 [Burkholderia cepacia]|uniref:Uncharacterized protein n=1 Tax=Burkholderia cepacia TaxID=292 RepID=A0A2S8HWR3_BURCE|nr:hypothetical protein C5615_38185 [Burkholderia cepacia]